MKELCQLAGNWDGRTVPAAAMIEPKLDGFRMLWLRDWEGRPTLRTRNGYSFEGVAHIAHELAAWERHAGAPWVFDGEFCVGDGPDTLARTKAWCEREHKLGGVAGRLFLFDGMPLSDWMAGGCDVPLWQRKAKLERIALAVKSDAAHAWDWRPRSHGRDEGAEPVRVVPHRDVWHADDVIEAATAMWDAGLEGVVIKNLFGGYRRNRSNDWQKIGRPWQAKLRYKRAA
jgi:ATP-dependent DNA ligase